MLVFDRPLVALGVISKKTPVTVLELMETKALRNLTEPERIEWGPPSLRNNLLTSGPGLRARLGMLQTKHAKTKVTTRFQRGDGTEVVHAATLAEVHKPTLVPYAQAVQAHLKASCDPALRAIRAIDLGAQGKGAAYVNQPGWMVSSAFVAMLRWPFHSLFARHLRCGELAELTRDTRSRVLSASGKVRSPPDRCEWSLPLPMADRCAMGWQPCMPAATAHAERILWNRPLPPILLTPPGWLPPYEGKSTPMFLYTAALLAGMLAPTRGAEFPS